MKKCFIIACVLFIAATAHAQLSNTTWKGAIKGDAAQAAVLKFGKDSAALNNAGGGLI